MVEGQWARTLISKVIVVGCLPVVVHLFEAAQSRPPLMTELNIPQGQNGLIRSAVFANHVGILEYLLGQQDMKAHVRHRNAREENMLHLASRFCNPTVFVKLVPLLLDCIHQRDMQGETVLDWIVGSGAASGDRCEAASILLAAMKPVFSEQQLETLGAAELRRLMDSEGTS